ncbi:MAG: HDIG domain-containing protein [Myxococcales bacterium]|nr:HDIG domain-containing protein [Myxococcales bacterium]MCB9708310.1 HDIG domain-containing protein [Myxococcales bacterium]
MLRTRLIAGVTAALVLSAVCATLLTLITTAETFFEPLRVDPSRPAPVTLRLPQTAIPVFDSQSGHNRVRVVEVMVPRGSTVTDPTVAGLVRAYELSRRPPNAGSLLGLWFVYFLIFMMLASYLRRLSPGRGALLRTQVGLVGLILFCLVLAKVGLLYSNLPAYLIPVAAVPLWVTRYLDRRSAFIVSIGLSFLTASLHAFSLTLLSVYLAASMTATLVLGHRRRWLRYLTTGVASGLAAAAMLLAAKSWFSGGFSMHADLSSPWDSELMAAFAGGIFAGALAQTLEGPAIILLGAVSRARLLDLSDLDQPLLRKMAKEAPGSWEHSRAMANLAEVAAASIGADALLTRIGAYYHDLGKTRQCKYFVENLEPGEISPHEALDPDVSADAIMHHVVEGTRILRAGRIPEPVVEFAYTHHGTSVIEYFWHKCLAQGNPKNIPESFFRYPGMRPRTKETAILMLIDSIEAASRTIDPPERDKFNEMVQRIIFVKLQQGQLDESSLTTSDLRILSTQLTDTLCNVYHSRIRYPWQDAKSQGREPLPVPGLATEDEVAQAHTANLKARNSVREDMPQHLSEDEMP